MTKKEQKENERLAKAIVKYYNWVHRTCGNCEYFTWDRRDKPCCHCVNHSEFEECKE